MADIEPPSFSLGLDLDADPEFELPTSLQQSSNINSAPGTSSHFDDDEENFGRRVTDPNEEDFGLQVTDSDPEPISPRIFKRLRRGQVTQQSGMTQREVEKVFCDNGDDEIEEFSSQEDFIKDEHPLREYGSVCSSSKVPLRGCGALTTKSSNPIREKKIGRTSDVPSSSHSGTDQNGLIFPRLTVSPLRRFQLVDSDTEEPSMNKDVSRKIPGIDSSLKEQQHSACLLRKNLSAEKHQNEDLWKDFSSIKNFHIPTPALDEFCQEYFQSVEEKNASQKMGGHLHKSNGIGYQQDANTSTNFEQCWNLAESVPPAHNYFFHCDPRIQALVRCRLPHFSPLGIVNKRENQQSSESVINYMSQFNGEASKRGAAQRNNNEKGSTRGRGRTKKPNTKEAQSSEGWVDPKSSTTIPKDAGKRRVRANGQAAGRWYTSPEGRKVYISGSGHELSGQMAYRQYRKDSGGFRKPKKKTNVKRKKG